MEISFSLQCPEHNTPIGMLNIDPYAQKIGYCFECIEQSEKNGAPIKTLKTISSILSDCSGFYEKCRERARNTGEPPAKFLGELSKKGERLEKLSKHIDEEKDRVKKSFEEIRKIALQIVSEKEKECLESLDREVSDLSEAYQKLEKLISRGWPKPSDIQALYPELDALKQRIAKIENIDQLEGFMAEVQGDMKRERLLTNHYENGWENNNEIKHLIGSLHTLESSLPKVSTSFTNPDTLEAVIKDLMKKFIDKEVEIESSFVAKIKSSIISPEKFEVLRDWLPQGSKSNPKLLYRGSVDGMACEKFHEKCDGKGATITLLKCRFKGAQESSVLGGFIDKSWHSNELWTSSKEAFLFSLKEGKAPIKCPILESESNSAFYGAPKGGLYFGNGTDLYVREDFKTGLITPRTYSNAVALCDGKERNFSVEDIEVFLVQEGAK